MLRPIAAGLMCLGFVTLGVAISRGQDEDLIVVEGNVQAAEVKADDAKVDPPAGALAPAKGERVEISIGDDADANVNFEGQALRVFRVADGEIVVSNEEGRVVERHEAGLTPARLSARFARGPQAVDPQTREMLDKMTAALKDQIQKLENEGKNEEAQQKTQSLRAIESLLHANPRGSAFFFQQRHREANQSMDAMKKLHARLHALVEQSSKLPDGAADDRDKLHHEIESIKREIAEKHQQLTASAPVGGQPPQFGPGQPFNPGMAAPQFTQQPPGTPQPAHGPGYPFNTGWPFTGLSESNSEGVAMLRKSEALSQAAVQLKKNGLDEQSQPLLAQAEQFRAKAQQLMQAEAEKHRAQAGHGGEGGGRGGLGPAGGFGGGPPLELHRSIRELQEQIQQLRKEVGELRELLQRRQ